MRKQFTLLLIVILSGCASFHQARYGQLDKVPAHGIRAEIHQVPDMSVKIRPAETSYSQQTDTTFIANEQSVNDGHKQSANVLQSSHRSAGLFKNTISRADCSISYARPQHVVPMTGHPNGHVAFFVFVALLLGIFLFSYGIVFLVVGIYALSLLLTLGGAILIFLGLMPLGGVISMMKGNRGRHKPDFRE